MSQRAQESRKERHTHRPAILVTAAVLAVLTVLPWMSSGVDIYVHAIWTHQVMRTLSTGSLPLWLPDLNAGCGSPGIRLYSPGGPVIAGLLGLAGGGAAAGLRLALAAAAFALLWLFVRAGVERPAFALALVATAPAVLADLATRGAWSELLAIPLAWWLLDHAAGRRDPASWRLVSLALAGLWLVHAPTAVMTAILLGLATLADGARRAADLVLAGAVAGALVAWHALPLLSEMALVKNRHALVGGIFVARNNLLGGTLAHDPGLNAGLSAAAIALLLAVLVEGWPRSDPRRAALITLCAGLASPLAAPLWVGGSPLQWLQFPWRWLLPATLLAVRPLALRTPIRNPRSWALGTLWLVPLLVLPLPGLVRAPHLGVREGWQTTGRRLEAAIGSNPLLVDAPQNRPPWYRQLAVQLPPLGVRRARADVPDIRLTVATWRPLHRVLTIDTPAPALVTLRLLDYPWWQPAVDGHPPRTIRNDGLLRVRVPAGVHTLDVHWTGNPLAHLGQALAGAAILFLLLGYRKTLPRPAP